MKYPKAWLAVLSLFGLLNFLPMAVAPLFARQGDELGRAATCLCLIPDFSGCSMPPGLAIVLLIFFVGIGILALITEDKKRLEAEKQRQAEAEKARLKREEDIRVYGDYIGRRPQVKGWCGNYFEGVVTAQNGDKLTITYLDDAGKTHTVERTIEEIKQQ